MGNGVSHSSSVAKDKDNLVDEGHAGQFHRVLVEPEYSLPGPPTVADDPHNTATLKIGTKSDSKNVDKNKDEDDHSKLDDKKETRTNEALFSTDTDYAVIEDESSALISESTDKEELEINEKSGQSKDNDNTIITSDTEHSNDDENITSSNYVDASPTVVTDTEITPIENTDVSETVPLTKGGKRSETKSKKESVKKESKSLLNMFKFSKHKPKVVAEFVVNGNDEQQQKEKTQNNEIKNVKCSTDSDLIDSLTETSVDGDESLSLIVDKGKDLLIQKVKNKQKDKETLVDEEKSDKTVKTDQSNNLSITDDDEKTPLNVERLNSLDSGIVVDKHSMNGQHLIQNVEADVKDQTIVTHNSDQSNGQEPKSNTVSVSNDINMHADKDIEANESTNMVSGDKDNGDINCTSERPIDVVGLEPTVGNQTFSVVESTETNGDDNKIKTEQSNESMAKTELGITPGTSEENTLEKEKKTKKKSWSFQFGGSKKNVNSSEKIDASTTSVDKTDSKKKSKSIWGKFSFRKSTDDLSKIPNGDELIESEKVDTKKKNKLKKIKAKKEKKASLKKKSVDSEDMESFNNTDGRLSEGTNTPRSRRSLVEEDATVSQTDAFEGVSLSDLSLDGDVQVSHNPNGPDLHDTLLDKQLKASLAKTTENLHSISDSDLHADAKLKTPITEDEKLKVSAEKTDAMEEDKLPENQTKLSTGEDAEVVVSNDEKKVEQHSESANEYAHVVKDKTKTIGSLQEIEYANLHVLPKTEPVLEEREESQIINENGLNNVETDRAKLSNEEPVVTADIVSFEQKYEKTDSEKIVTESNKLEESVAQTMNDSENTAKHDAALPHGKGEDSSSGIIIENISRLKHVDVSPGGAENQEESDAYVHLVQLVKDYRDDNFEKHLNGKPNQTVTGTNSVSINLVPVAKQTINSDLKANSVHELKESPGQKKRLVVMKEVGVQAPDIHIPMDIEKDFGCNSKHGDLVDVGVQVSDKDFDESGYYLKDGSEILKSPSVSIVSAYF